MDRSKKPSAIGVSPSLPQPTISFVGNEVEAKLPKGGSVTVNLFGATVTSWKLPSGKEQLFLSEKAHLDGSKPIRGGIPLVFPVFGAPPKDHATSSLPQHGFARNSKWEFLGKSSSESLERSKSSDETVKLDFGLSHTMLSEDFQKAWSYEFELVYSIILSGASLETQLQVNNKSSKSFEFQVLTHTYLRIEDISKIRIEKLQSKTYVDKTQNATTHIEKSPALAITQETDRIYQGLEPNVPVVVSSTDGKTLFSISRMDLNDTVIWNPWAEKAKGMADFAPDDAYKKMVCVESGSVSAWQSLEAGEFWVGGQTIQASLDA